MHETLKKILDKGNKHDSVVLIGYMNAIVGSNEVTNLVGANGEAV